MRLPCQVGLFRSSALGTRVSYASTSQILRLLAQWGVWPLLDQPLSPQINGITLPWDMKLKVSLAPDLNQEPFILMLYMGWISFIPIFSLDYKSLHQWFSRSWWLSIKCWTCWLGKLILSYNKIEASYNLFDRKCFLFFQNVYSSASNLFIGRDQTNYFQGNMDEVSLASDLAYILHIGQTVS